MKPSTILLAWVLLHFRQEAQTHRACNAHTVSSYLCRVLTPQQQQQLQAELTSHPPQAEPLVSVGTEEEAVDGDTAWGAEGARHACSPAGMRS